MYKRFSRVLGLAALLAILSLATVHQASAQTTFVSKLNGLCLAVRDGKIANSSTMMTWTCIPGDPAQTFYFSNGFMRIGSATSQFCLASFNALNANAPLGVWGCQNGPDGRSHPTQTFNLGMYQDLRISTSNLCLNVQGGNRAAGTPIILWQCSQGSQAGDMWQAQRAGGTPPSQPPPPTAQAPPPPPRPVAPPPAAPPATVTLSSFHLISAMGSRCLAVRAGSTRPGTHLIVWPCLDSAEQGFSFMGDGTVRLFGGVTNYCLDLAEGFKSGAHPETNTCNGSATQKWNYTNGHLIAANNMCLDFFGGAIFNVASGFIDAQISACNNGANQSFVIGLRLPAGNSVNTVRPDTASRISAVGNPNLFISHNGSALIAISGGGLVAAGGGNLVAAGGGNLVAAGGGNLVAAGGGNLVAAGGGNLVAAGGGNLTVSGGGAGGWVLVPFASGVIAARN